MLNKKGFLNDPEFLAAYTRGKKRTYEVVIFPGFQAAYLYVKDPEWRPNEPET